MRKCNKRENKIEKIEKKKNQDIQVAQRENQGSVLKALTRKKFLQE